MVTLGDQVLKLSWYMVLIVYCCGLGHDLCMSPAVTAAVVAVAAVVIATAAAAAAAAVAAAAATATAAVVA